MSKYLLKIKAQKLRRRGKSLNDIVGILSVSKSTASLWCKDLKLTENQAEKIMKSKFNKIRKGYLKGAYVQKMKKLKVIESAVAEAQTLEKLTDREYFVAGLALYLAEGSKKMGRVQFVNSDKRIILFMLKWFTKFYKITKNDIKCTILINATHKNRDRQIKNHWQKFLKIKSERFTDIRYVKTKQKKVYANHNQYFGIFSFRVNKSAHLLYKLNAFTDRMLEII